MIILNIIIDPSSSNWGKQMQRSTVENWAELPKSSQRKGGVWIWAKRSRPLWGYPLKQLTWANGSLRILTWEQGNQHRTKLVPLSVGDSYMTRADCGVTGSETMIYPYCFFWLFGTHYVWRDTFVNLYVLEKPCSCLKAMCSTLWTLHRKPYPLWGVDGCGMGSWVGKVEGAETGERKEQELDLACRMRKDSALLKMN